MCFKHSTNQGQMDKRQVNLFNDELSQTTTPVTYTAPVSTQFRSVLPMEALAWVRDGEVEKVAEWLGKVDIKEDEKVVHICLLSFRLISG